MSFVYFIHETGNNEMFKIGKTECHPADRLAQLQTGNPRILKIYRWIRLPNSANTRHHTFVEEYLHARFAESRIHGEWFYATMEQIDAECKLVIAQFADGGEEKVGNNEKNQVEKPYISGKWEPYTDKDILEVKKQRKAAGKYKGKTTPEQALEKKNKYLNRKTQDIFTFIDVDG